MILLDAYAVLAFLRDEAAAESVHDLLESGEATVTTVGLAETLDHLVRLMDIDEEQATLDIAQLGLLDAATPVDTTTGIAAGILRASHYHRTRCAVSMADCVAAETARRTAAPLATSDPYLLDVCHAEGIDTVVLPASDGSIWTPTG